MRTGSHHRLLYSSVLLADWQKITLILMLLSVSFIVVGCATKQGRGSGNVTRETRSVSGFSEVALSGIGNLAIKQTGSESLAIEAEDNVLPHIQTSVKNNRLTIELDSTTPMLTKSINYELTVKDLSALQLQGVANIDASDISTDRLNVSTSSTGDLKIAGEANSQAVDVSGAGSYRAQDLATKKATVNVSGPGEAVVNVSDELSAKISGAGSVEYIGNPTVSQNITGPGTVRRR